MSKLPEKDRKGKEIIRENLSEIAMQIGRLGGIFEWLKQDGIGAIDILLSLKHTAFVIGLEIDDAISKMEEENER